jgi:NAD(P)-dependent dehydrogenase (short-subunit alcohol dehydrogenase family)
MDPDSLSLQGKIAIVTGSGKENGIGAAIATALARNGCSVAINHVSDDSSHRAAEVEAKIKSLGARVVTIQADISTVDGAKEIVKRTLSAFNSSKIDILGKIYRSQDLT